MHHDTAETLLAVVTAFSAKSVVGNAISFIQKQCPFLFPFFAHSRHGNCPFSFKMPMRIDRHIVCCVSVPFLRISCPVSPLCSRGSMSGRVSSICMKKPCFGSILILVLSLMFLLLFLWFINFGKAVGGLAELFNRFDVLTHGFHLPIQIVLVGG